MIEESVITEELKSLVGVEAEPAVYEIEKGHVRQFAEAITDPNPLWHDEAYAREKGYGGTVAPPGYLCIIGLTNHAEKLRTANCPLPRWLNAGDNIECYKPIVAGDTITAVAKLADLNERQGKTGKLLFMTSEITFKNQRGELVARRRQTFVRR